MSASDFLLTIALASAAGGMVILFALLRWRDRRDAGLFRAAVRLRGRVPDSDGLELRSIQFTIDGRPASAEFEEGESKVTRVKVSMRRRSPGVFRVIPQNVARLNARFIGSPDIRVGSPAFDKAWYVTARPSSLAGRIFSEDRRDRVVASVERLARFESPSIEVTRDTLVVRVNGILTREIDLLDLAATATEFVGYLFHLGPEEGIAWVDNGDVDPGLCPVCAAPMKDGIVLCNKCRTPHHEECWLYVGQCSTYACKGKRFIEGPVSDRGGAAAS